MFFVIPYESRSKIFKIYKNSFYIMSKKNFISKNFNFEKNEKKIVFYPEFLGIEYENKIKKKKLSNINSLAKKIILNNLKSWILIYTIGIFALFPEKIILQISMAITHICKSSYFFILIIIANQFFLKISKYLKFIYLLLISLFLTALSTSTEYFLKINHFLNAAFFVTITIKILILNDLWFDKFLNSEIKNIFFINSIIYRKIRIVITALFFLDLIIKIFLYISLMKNFIYCITIKKISTIISMFMVSKKILSSSEIINSYYSILIFFITNCILIFLYYIAFYKKKRTQIDINKIENIYGSKKKFNFLNKNDLFQISLSTFLSIQRKNENFLLLNNLTIENKICKNLDEKKRWIIKKNGINTPFGALLYDNELQVTKQRIWYETKNKKS